METGYLEISEAREINEGEDLALIERLENLREVRCKFLFSFYFVILITCQVLTIVQVVINKH